MRGFRFWLTALCVWMTIIAAMAQEFTVEDQQGGRFNRLDQTITVTLTVRLSGAASALSDVVPYLAPPTCAQVPPNNAVSTAYLGYESGVSTIQAPVASWDNDTTRDLVFEVHVYDQADICTTLCPSGLACSLTLTYGFNPDPLTAQDPSSLLILELPDENTLRLTEVAAHFHQYLGSILSGLPTDWPLDTYSIIEDPLSPGLKFLLYFDWNAYTTNPRLKFLFFYYPIATSCGLRVDTEFYNETIQPVSYRVIDETWMGGGEEVIQAPMGGAGGPSPNEHGINVFDFTDVPASCGGSVASNFGFTPGVQYYVSFTLNEAPCVLRDVRLYVGRLDTCQATMPVFGVPDSDFRVTRVDLASDGTIHAELSVPLAWMSGGTLAPEFSAEWVLSRYDTHLPLTDLEPSQRLSLDAQTGLALTPDYAVMARIRHVSTGAVVATTSPQHEFGYATNGLDYAHAEVPDPDNFLDSGEILTLNYQVTNLSGGTVSNVLLETGVVQTTGVYAWMGADVLPTTFAPGQVEIPDLDVELIYSDPPCCGTVPFFAQTAYSIDGWTSSFKQIWDWPINGDPPGETDGAFDIVNSMQFCRSLDIDVAVRTGNPLEFSWYDGIDGLIDDAPLLVNAGEEIGEFMVGHWLEPPDPGPGIHEYFVKIEDLSTGTIRNLVMSIIDPTIGGQPIPELGVMLPQWLSTSPDFDFVVDGSVNILDFVLRESAEECLVQ